MKCYGCGFDVQDDFAFCPRCGKKQAVSCAGCGFVCAAEFAFCPKCGSPLSIGAAKSSDAAVFVTSAPPPATTWTSPRQAQDPALPAQAAEGAADRRIITVLFADLSGFTALAERHDPEVIQALQKRLFDSLTASVETFGGFVDKFLGDALLALFGAPVAHEDDAERALLAALDMMKRIVEFGEPAGSSDSSLMLHIGINTGPVVTGRVGIGTAGSYSVTGDTVNTAQRLQALGGPGEILVGPLTQRLTRHAFAYESVGDVVLRGKAGSVLVHRLVGRLPVPRIARGLEMLGLATPLIAREREIARMEASLDLACTGQIQLVRLIGEAGAGKSRLVREFIARLGSEPRYADVAVRVGACSPLGERSYGTLGTVVRAAAGIMQNAAATDMREKLRALLAELGFSNEDSGLLTPLLCHVIGLESPDGPLHHLEPEQLKRQMLYAVRAVVERRLKLSPLLIVVEDLHWADAVSLEALRFVMDRLEAARLMILVTQRPGVEIVQLDSERVSHTTIRLVHLSGEEGERLLETVFGCIWSTPAGKRLATSILERSGGNPLFIEETVRALVEMELIVREGQGWRVEEREARVETPATIQSLLLARIDRLSPPARRLAQDAAIIGHTFDDVLVRLVSSDVAVVDAMLDTLCEAEIIEEIAAAPSVTSRSFRFTHTLLHDVIYQNVLLQRRTAMHGKIAEALEQQVGACPQKLEDLTQLGHHFSLSNMPEKGAHYLFEAGERARAIFANDDALRFYERALALLTANDGLPLQLQLRERIAELTGAAGRRDEAQAHYGALIAWARDCGDTVAEARMLRRTGRLMWEAGKREEAQRVLAEAARVLGKADAPVERALLLQEHGRLAFRAGDHDTAVQEADNALSYVRTLLDRTDPELRREAVRASAESLNTKGVALARLGRGEAAIEAVEESVRLAELEDLLSVACRGYSNLSVLHSSLDPRRAIEACRRGLAIARRIRDLGMEARLLANLAVAACTFTEHCSTEGVPAAQRAVEIDVSLDQREHLPVPLIVLGQIHQCHGSPALAARYYNEALAVACETDDPQLLFPCYDGLATLSLDEDKIDEAERYFSLAQDVCTRHGIDPATLVLLPFLD